MPKTISVDEFTYSYVVSIAGKLMMYFGKPFSLRLTIFLAIQMLDKIIEKADRKQIEKAKQMMEGVSTEDVEKALEKAFELIATEKG